MKRTFLFLFSVFNLSFVFAHNKIGNGGAGFLSQDGDYNLMTVVMNENKFSGYSTEVENCGSEIFTEIKKDIRKMQAFLPPDIGVFLMKNACQSGYNKKMNSLYNPLEYSSFKMKISHFTNVYSLATGISKNRIVIYAVTIPEFQKTYFLEEFYRLTYMKQKIILFHEIFWLYFFDNNSVNLKLKQEVMLYKEILLVEQALSDYLVAPEDIRNRSRLRKALLDFKSFNSDAFTGLN